MPVTVGMPSLNNFDLDNIKSREELLDALYAVLEEIRHIDDTISEDNLTEELLEKINFAYETAKNPPRTTINTGVSAGKEWQIYDSLISTGLVNQASSAYKIGQTMQPNSVVGWTHDGTQDVCMNFPTPPESYGVVIMAKGTSNDYLSATFYGTDGGVYFWKYSTGASGDGYNNYWRRVGARSAVTISGVDSAQTLQNAETIVNLNSETGVTNASDSSLSVITKGIRCNEDGDIEISAACYANGLTSGDRVIVLIHKTLETGSDSTLRTTRWDAVNSRITGVIPAFVAHVYAGDKIYLYAYNYSGNGGSIPTGDQTYLTVRYL